MFVHSMLKCLLGFDSGWLIGDNLFASGAHWNMLDFQNFQ